MFLGTIVSVMFGLVVPQLVLLVCGLVAGPSDFWGLLTITLAGLVLSPRCGRSS